MKNDKPLNVAYKISRDGKAYIGFVVEKPGVMSFGPTLEEMLINIEDALLCMENYERHIGTLKTREFIKNESVKYAQLAK